MDIVIIKIAIDYVIAVYSIWYMFYFIVALIT